MKALKRTLLCTLFVVMLFSAVSVSAAGGASELAAHVSDSAGYIKSTLSDTVEAADGIAVLRLAKAGADISAEAEKLKTASEDAEITPAQAAVNFLALKAAGLEEGSLEFDLEADLSAENPYTLCYLLKEKDEISPALAQKLVEALMAFYNADDGKGFDYYGYSVDTNGLFISALKPYAADNDNVAKALEAALSYIEALESDDGYGFSEEYPDANASSTAAALSAFSAIGDADRADKAYKALLKYESPDEKGAYTYGGEVSIFSGSDAFRALLDYQASGLVKAENPETGSETVKAVGIFALSAMLVIAGFAVVRRKETLAR